MTDGGPSSQMSLTGTSPYTGVDSEKDNAGEDGQQKESVAEKGTTNSKKRKEMAPRSEVWNNFTKIFEGDVLTKAACNHCKREFACLIKRNGTSSLLKHLGTCKSNPDRVKDDKQPTLQATNNPNGTSSLIPWRYDAEKLRDALAEMIIMDELPFAYVEKPGFRSFVAKACPRFGVPSRRTATRDCVRIYWREKDKLKKFNILEWWKVNSSRFPVLSRLARDILAFPISTVASESAFSTGGRILDDFRSSLTPFMVQALICTQDWLRRSIPVNDEEDPEQLATLEEALLQEMADLNIAKSSSSAAGRTTIDDTES